jgi:hypothetical protein
VARSLLTSDDTIEVRADKSSGEVEFVLYQFDDGLWLGLGSDHTDRKAETIGVTLSKQLCAKPVSTQLWHYDEVKPHWDKLKLRSFVPDGGKRRLYQEGPVTNMRSPEELIRLYTGGDKLAPARDVLRHLRGARRDFIFRHVRHGAGGPGAGRKLTHGYKIVSLPDEG